MGRHDRQGTDRVDLVEDRPTQRRPLGGVGPGSHSSIRIRDFSVALVKIDETRRMCDEKVESDCSRLCSSPMSARMSSKIGSCDP